MNGFPVLCNGSAGYRYTFRFEQFCQARIAERGTRIFRIDQLANHGLDSRCGSSATIAIADTRTEKITKFECSTRCAKELACRRAGDGGFMQPQFFCDFAQGQGAHGLWPMFEKATLLPDDRAGDTQQGVCTRIEAFDQPASFLQLAAQVGVIGSAGFADQALVMPIDPDTRLAAARMAYLPNTLMFGGDAIRRDVVRGIRANLQPGFRVQAFQQ